MRVVIFLFALCVVFATSIDKCALLEQNENEAICCIPNEFEATLYLDFGIVFIDENTAFSYINGSVHATYSFRQKKAYFNLTGTEQSPLTPGPVPYDTVLLYDFQAGKMYTIDATGKCEKSGLDQNMTRYCVPETAEKLATGKFGSGNFSSTVTTYKYNTNINIPLQIAATMFVEESQMSDEGECFPISASFFTPSANPDSGSLYNLQFIDIGPVQTTDIFDVPKACL